MHKVRVMSYILSDGVSCGYWMAVAHDHAPPRLNLSFWVQMHHDLVCNELCLDL